MIIISLSGQSSVGQLKRLKYCRNYELPLFDQEQCYQFVIIDLCQLHFLLIAIRGLFVCQLVDQFVDQNVHLVDQN